ncbi:MAG: hypothetical protein AB1641_25730 [Thermodesulfobacteriota bacterium]
MKTLPSLAATVIGSVPFPDVNQALDLLAQACPLLPAWPQMVRVRPREGMVLQAVDGLPGLEVDEAGGRIRVRLEDREKTLTEFYERFLGGDLEYFGLPEEVSTGLAPFLRKAEKEPDFGPDFLKAQVIGPASFGLAVRTPDEKTLLDDPDLKDATVKGLGAKATWLARRIRATGRTPIIFFDEPGLAGFGSAFSPLDRDQVLDLWRQANEIVRSDGEVITGVHICGNTDWGMVTQAGFDVINFDAFGYLEQFLLYPADIGAFLGRGGYVAWGLVPTLGFTGRETADDLVRVLNAGIAGLAAKGLEPDLIRRQSLITPSCGTGPLSEAVARAVHRLLPQVVGRLR